MKSKILILLFCLLIITGCFKNENLSNEIKENQNKIKANLEKDNNEDIVIKFFNDNKEESYYIYKVDGNSFIQYLYTIHKSEKSFNENVSKYENNTYYELEKLEESLVTIIKLQRGSDDNLESSIEKIYSDKKYEIIK